MTISLLVLVPARKTFLDPQRALPGENHPLRFEVGMGPGEAHDRPPGANFNVVTVGAEAKQTIHSSEIQNRKHWPPA